MAGLNGLPASKYVSAVKRFGKLVQKNTIPNNKLNTLPKINRNIKLFSFAVPLHVSAINKLATFPSSELSSIKNNIIQSGKNDGRNWQDLSVLDIRQILKSPNIKSTGLPTAISAMEFNTKIEGENFAIPSLFANDNDFSTGNDLVELFAAGNWYEMPYFGIAEKCSKTATVNLPRGLFHIRGAGFLLKAIENYQRSGLLIQISNPYRMDSKIKADEDGNKKVHFSDAFSPITIVPDGILSIIPLAAKEGTVLTFEAEGPNAQEAVNTMTDFVSGKSKEAKDFIKELKDNPNPYEKDDQ